MVLDGATDVAAGAEGAAVVMEPSLALGSDGRLRRFGLHPRPRLRFLSAPDSGRSHADVAQLVEHHLAKVRVAGSNPVVRSERVSPIPHGESSVLQSIRRSEASQGGVAERRGNGLQIRVHGFKSRLHLGRLAQR